MQNLDEILNSLQLVAYRGPRGGVVWSKRGDAICRVNVIDQSDELALVEVVRQRNYARCSKWGPSFFKARYLVGRNENGNPFSHCVSKRAETVTAALTWIWGTDPADLVARQGDVAIVRGRGKHHSLPESHVLVESPDGLQLVHAHKDADGTIVAQHAPVAVPAGCKIIVGRRADDRLSRESHD